MLANDATGWERKPHHGWQKARSAQQILVVDALTACPPVNQVLFTREKQERLAGAPRLRLTPQQSFKRD